jgi:hypothetical protein
MKVAVLVSLAGVHKGQNALACLSSDVTLIFQSIAGLKCGVI